MTEEQEIYQYAGYLDELDPNKRPASAVCEWYNMVKKLCVMMSEPVGDERNPSHLLRDRRVVHSMHMMEEVVKFASNEHIIDQIDALLDTIVFALCALVEMGIDPAGMFDAVHNSNLGKLWADGRPHYDQNDRLMKPPTWEPAGVEIQRVILERMKEMDDDVPF